MKVKGRFPKWVEITSLLGSRKPSSFVHGRPFYRLDKIAFQAYGKYAQGTGSMIDMLEKEPLNQSAESSKERIPENYQLRYFTEMEVAGLMGFPKCFSFPSELTTRQVN